MMHVNVRKLKQLHVKVGSVDFWGGGGIKFLKIFSTYQLCKLQISKGREIAILSKVNARGENTLALMYVCPSLSRNLCDENTVTDLALNGHACSLALSLIDNQQWHPVMILWEK